SFREPICGLDEACLTADRLRLDRLPATAASDFLPRSPASSSPTHKSATCRPPLHCGLYQVRSDRHRSFRQPSRPRWARPDTQKRNTTMAQIGTFTRDETGAYNGTIK